MIGLGSAVGFRPATDESLAPVKLIQEAYVERYGLKKYAPTIMIPHHFNMHSEKEPPVYYSLQLPTTMTFSPKGQGTTPSKPFGHQRPAAFSKQVQVL